MFPNLKYHKHNERLRPYGFYLPGRYGFWNCLGGWADYFELFMKKAILISIIFLGSTSCQKEWKCKSVTTMNGNVTVTETTFTGSKDDMKDHEAVGTFDYGWLSQETKCNPE